MVKAFEAKHISLDDKYYPEDACSLQPTISASGECDQEVPGEHQTGPRNEVSARYEPRQRSDAAHQHEDQVGWWLPGCAVR